MDVKSFITFAHKYVTPWFTFVGFLTQAKAQSLGKLGLNMVIWPIDFESFVIWPIDF
jgi:hypothetical protein